MCPVPTQHPQWLFNRNLRLNVSSPSSDRPPNPPLFLSPSQQRLCIIANGKHVGAIPEVSHSLIARSQGGSKPCGFHLKMHPDLTSSRQRQEDNTVSSRQPRPSSLHHCNSRLFGFPPSTLGLFKRFSTQQPENPLERRMLRDTIYM